MSGLRTKADKLLSVPRTKRALDEAKKLPEDIKKLVSSIQSARLLLRGTGYQLPTSVGILEQIQERAWQLREYGGRERTYLAIAVAKGSSIQSNILSSMAQLHLRAFEAMRDIELLAAHDGVPLTVQEMVRALKAEYFGSYEALRKKILDESWNFSPDYGVTFPAFFAASSSALGKAEGLESLASQEVANYWHTQSGQAIEALAIEFAMFLMFLVAALIATIIGSRMFRDLDRLSSVMIALADGDKSVEVPGQQRPDELGAMAQTVQEFKKAAISKDQLEVEAEQQRQRSAAADEAANLERNQAIDKIAEGLSQIAAQNLGCRMQGPIPEAYQQLMSDLNSSVAGLAETMTAISRSATAIASGSGEVSNSASDLARRTDSQAASLEETTVAVVEVSSTVSDTAKNAGAAQ